jgi:predicted Zn-dependent protease
MPIVDRISPKREIQLGQLIFNSIIKDEKIDSTKSIIVNNFWKEMHFETSYPIKITVVKNKDINAFALPGGNIVIYDSILSTMTSYEELAALLSHEYIHVRNRHSMQSIVSAYSSLIIIELFLGNTNNTIQSIFQNANAFVSLKYSRNLEKEADNQGMELMYSHQIAPIGMHELFKKLEDSDSDSNNIPEFLNNHPIIKDRLSYSKKYASTHTVKENNKALIELFSSIKN